jgi:hypothetical protein
MQYGTIPPTANAGVEFLHDTFDDRVLLHHYPAKLEEVYTWARTSLDLNLHDYFFWGFLQSKCLRIM